MKALISCTLLLTTLIAAGCSNRVDEVNTKLDEIRNSPTPAVPLPPQYVQIANFEYSAQQLRNPFVPTSIAEELKVLAGKQVIPDFSRPRESLEEYPLDTLQMRGSIAGATKTKFYGLIETASKELIRVQEGDHLGRDYGKITKITPNRIEIMEVVSDGKGGYVERPRVMNILEAGVVQAG